MRTDQMGCSDGFELLDLMHQAFLQGAKLVIELCQEVLAQGGACGLCCFEGRQEGVAKFRHPLRKDNPIFP
jgi:hypothetical protein